MKRIKLITLVMMLFCMSKSYSQNISTIAGTGIAGFSGDGGSATAADLNITQGVFDAAGNLYIADDVIIEFGW